MSREQTRAGIYNLLCPRFFVFTACKGFFKPNLRHVGFSSGLHQHGEPRLLSFGCLVFMKSWNCGIMAWFGLERTSKSPHSMGGASCPTLGGKGGLDPLRSHCPPLHELPDFSSSRAISAQQSLSRDSHSIARGRKSLEKVPPQSEFPVTHL